MDPISIATIGACCVTRLYVQQFYSSKGSVVKFVFDSKVFQYKVKKTGPEILFAGLIN